MNLATLWKWITLRRRTRAPRRPPARGEGASVSASDDEVRRLRERVAELEKQLSDGMESLIASGMGNVGLRSFREHARQVVVAWLAAPQFAEWRDLWPLARSFKRQHPALPPSEKEK